MALYGPLTQFSAVQLNSVVLFSFLLAFIADPSDVDSHGHTAMFYSVKEASLIGNVTVVKQTTSDVECAFLCLRMYPGSCFSFNFDRTVTLTKLHDCELSNSEGALKPHKMYSRRGFDYFGMESVVSFNRNRYIKAIPLVLFCYFFNQVNEIINCSSSSNFVIRQALLSILPNLSILRSIVTRFKCFLLVFDFFLTL